MDIQTPVEVVSNEIEVHSPMLPDLGVLKVDFAISIAAEREAAPTRKRYSAGCATGPGTSIECTVFHFAIRNLGERPIRNGRFSCSDFSIVPGYRTNDGEWKQLHSQLMACTANVYFETPILPGAAEEGNFILGALAPRFDTSPLYPAGKYEFRFRFYSSACWASPDGSFCIQQPKAQVTATSNTLTVVATAFSNGSSTR
ncbi:MAG: hypothetical protein WBD67_05285 [Terracidiphilus sp.]